ncbi:unnamed protein product, partial [Ascophyllum nodosum]
MQVDRARRVHGRPGVRLVVHILVHLEQMLRDHGVFPNSSIGKARRDINVTSGLISPDQ